MAKIKLKPQFKRSTFREFRFICPELHVTRKWCWNDLERIQCQTCFDLGTNVSWACRSDQFEKITSELTAYYRGPDGKLFIPGQHDSRLVPKGYERIEIRNFRDRDRFYREANLSDNIEHERNAETEEIVFGEMRRQERSDLRMQMQSMSPQGREFARRSMERTDAESKQKYESRGYLVGWEYDRGNR